MERNLFRYIWLHTRRDQIWIILITILAMIPFYMSFDLPKQIINGPISGIGFEQDGATLPFGRVELELPVFGSVVLFPGVELQRLPLLIALSLAFLGLVIVNGLIKVYTNTYKGKMGERLLRRLRFELIDRILRFPPKRFKRMKAGEVGSMVKDEVEPFGGFSGEAFASPVMLAGQALTAMIFILVQHVGLGLAALAMASIQVLVIPKLRARLIVLGRERQLKARQLAGSVAEVVEGIDTIHVSDTTNYIRASMVERLGTIFKIRYDIYQWKFFVKFLNNFIAQMTPFLFYSVGGYLAIIGELDVGQLVAVINAYKELPGPMKGLIDWDMARQDVQVKFEAVVNQFDTDVMIDPALHKVDTKPVSLAGEPLQVKALSLTDDSGTVTLKNVSASFALGQSIAFVGSGSSGAEALAEAVGRLVWPADGAVQIGESDILHLPESITGRRITYASPSQYFFSGSLGDNLLFRLKNVPMESANYEGEELDFRKWWCREADLTGNPVLDLNDQWIDEALVLAHTSTTSLTDAIGKVMEIVELTGDLAQLALQTPLDPKNDAALAEELVSIRGEFAEELRKRGWEDIVQRFEPDTYIDEATIVENLFFGGLKQDGAIEKIGSSDFIKRITGETGLRSALLRSGCEIAQKTFDLFHDLPEDHPFYERMKLLKPTELKEYQISLGRVRALDPEKIADAETSEVEEDVSRIICLNAHYSEGWYRFGILTQELKSLILTARKRIRNELPAELADLVEFYDPERYLFQSDIRENITFGKIASQTADAAAYVAEVMQTLRSKHADTVKRVVDHGLAFEVGPSGRRLSATFRTKTNLARALLRQSDIYIFNRPLLGVDQASQTRIIDATLRFLRDRERAPLVIWVLADSQNANAFDRVVQFENGGIVADLMQGESLRTLDTGG